MPFLTDHWLARRPTVRQPSRLVPFKRAASLAQLNAANIQLIYAYWTGGGNPVIYILGLDRKFRPL